MYSYRKANWEVIANDPKKLQEFGRNPLYYAMEDNRSYSKEATNTTVSKNTPT